jgi:hypothetical protein
MADKDVTHTDFDAGSCHDILHISAQIVSAATLGLYNEFLLGRHDSGEV